MKNCGFISFSLEHSVDFYCLVSIFQISLYEPKWTNYCKILDPYERPIENIEYDEWYGKYYSAALVDPLSDFLRCHRCEIMQLGESRSAWKWLRRWGTAVDGRDAADRTRIRIRILILLYSHRRDVECARKTLKMINTIIYNRYYSFVGESVWNKPQWLRSFKK